MWNVYQSSLDKGTHILYLTALKVAGPEFEASRRRLTRFKPLTAASDVPKSQVQVLFVLRVIRHHNSCQQNSLIFFYEFSAISIGVVRKRSFPDPRAFYGRICTRQGIFCALMVRLALRLRYVAVKQEAFETLPLGCNCRSDQRRTLSSKMRRFGSLLPTKKKENHNTCDYYQNSTDPD